MKMEIYSCISNILVSVPGADYVPSAQAISHHTAEAAQRERGSSEEEMQGTIRIPLSGHGPSRRAAFLLLLLTCLTAFEPNCNSNWEWDG